MLDPFPGLWRAADVGLAGHIIDAYESLRPMFQRDDAMVAPDNAQDAADTVDVHELDVQVEAARIILAMYPSLRSAKDMRLAINIIDSYECLRPMIMEVRLLSARVMSHWLKEHSPHR